MYEGGHQGGYEGGYEGRYVVTWYMVKWSRDHVTTWYRVG